jgi:phosphatidylglycerophosphate synthase
MTGNPDERSGLPALIYCDEQTAGLRIAALTLADRLVVALHRAGAGPITLVARGGAVSLKRATALGIPVRVVNTAPVRNRATLVASTSLLVQTADIRALVQNGGRLVAKDGTPLPVGVLPAGDDSWPKALDQLPTHVVAGVAFPVTDAASARTAEKALWASLTSSSDGLVDKVFNRPCGRPLSKLLIHFPVSPNAVSLASVAIGLAAAWFFAVGDPKAAILAAILFQVSAIVDCVDGDIARVVFKESPLGKWIDLVGDQVVHVSVFAAIAIGIVRNGQSSVGLWLGLSAVLGAVLSFVVVLRGMRQPEGARHRLLQKLIDSATNRDFSVLVLILACFNRLEWFLWMSAVGSHLFWITALALQRGMPSPAGRQR